MERGVSLYIDPSGAQTGGRVVKRELKEIGDAAVTAQQKTEQLTQAQIAAAKAAQANAQVTAQQLEAMRAKFDPLFAVQQRYKVALESVNEAQRLGAITASQAIDLRIRETAAMNAQISVLGNLAAKQKAAAQAAVDRRTISPDRGADVAAYGAELDKLRERYNPLYAVTTRYLETKADIRRAHQVGAISATEMTTALGRERQAALASMAAIKGHTNALNSDRRAAAQRANLIFQLNDIFVSLASGMNPGMVAIQQGSQISTIYGPGGMGKALSETGKMAGELASKFRVAGIAGGIMATLVGNGMAHIREEASKTLQSTVTWGEVFTATIDVISAKLRSAFGPTITAYILDPLSYAFNKIMSATTDLLEWSINGWRSLFSDIGFLWDQLPNIVGAAFVGAVNMAIDHMNKLVTASKEAVNQIIDAFNLIPGADLSKLDTSGQAIPRLDNTYATDLAKARAAHEEQIRGILGDRPIRGLGDDIENRIGTNRAQSRLADLANLDFGKSIQGATALGQAVGGIATAAQQAHAATQTIIDVHQQMLDGRRQTMMAFEQSGNQLRTMKTELKEIQATLAAAAKTPVKDVFGDLMSENAAGAIDAAASSIQKLFKAMDLGMPAKDVHASLELIRQSLHQLGGDTASVDQFVNALINGNFRARELESSVKSLSASILNIPNKMVNIGIRQYTVGATGGGTKGINVYGGGADFTQTTYSVGGGKSVGVYAGQGNYSDVGGTKGYYYDQPGDLQAIDDMYGTNYAGARAAGGPVVGGKQYLVGENGPELVTMGGTGNVTNANSTASILSGGRDTLSLIEDHLYSVMQEVRIHTGYWETAESNALEIITCLQAIKSLSSSLSASAKSSSAGNYSSGSSRAGGSFASSSSARSQPGFSPGYSGGMMHISTYDASPAKNPYALNNEIGIRGDYKTYVRQGLNGFATGGQIMPGEDQRVEFFKKNSERVIIVDDAKVSDGRGGSQQKPRSERPVTVNVQFTGGDLSDKRAQQAMADQFRRAVQQAVRS